LVVKITLPNTIWQRLWSTELVTTQLSPVSTTKNVLKGQWCASAKEVDEKSTEKWLPGMLPEALQIMVKMSLIKGTAL
jgi:hypothetical protein